MSWGGRDLLHLLPPSANVSDARKWPRSRDFVLFSVYTLKEKRDACSSIRLVAAPEISDLI